MKKIKDFYYKKAKEESYAARSVYKLKEIDDKYHLIKKGQIIMDIGCAPGSWSQFVLKRFGNGTLVGIDITSNIKIKDPRFHFIQHDILKIDLKKIKEIADYVDLILSDAAPFTTGDKFTDSQNSMRLVERVFNIADHILKIGGNVVAKVFQGEDLDPFIKEILKEKYQKIIRFKPKSSRKESKEIYILALNKL